MNLSVIWDRRITRIVMERQEKQAVFLLIMVICIVSSAHVMVSLLGNEAFAAPYTPEVSEGSLVRLEGPVDAVTTTQEGGHVILQVQGVRVFMPSSVAVQHMIIRGDQIRIYGVVQVYRGQREVVVSRASDVTRMSPS
jgi:OB-fold nucleic acid binding domain.